MVIGVDDVVAAFGQTEVLQRQIGDHFVGIHVGRGAGAALDHIDDKFSVQFAGDQVVAGLANGIALAGSDGAELHVGMGAGFFHQRQRANQLGHLRHGVAGDGEILNRARGVYTPIGCWRNGFYTDKVAFLAHGRLSVQGGRNNNATRSGTQQKACTQRRAKALSGRS